MELSNKERGLNSAYEGFIKDFKSTYPEQIAEKSGSIYNKKTEEIILKYLNKDYTIDVKTGEIVDSNSNKVPISLKTFLMGYLVTSEKTMETGEFIKFRNIHGASQYEGPFNSRTIIPMSKTFGKRPEDFLRIGEEMGGRKADIADVSFSLQVLPFIKVIYGLYLESEEFSSEGLILFDSSIRRLCTSEIIVVAASNPIYEMLRKQ